MGNKTRSLEELQQTGKEDLVRITELSLLSDIRVSTIKWYSEIGILPFEQSGARLTRKYRKGKTLKRLTEIQNLKDKGYSMEEIKTTLSV